MREMEVWPFDVGLRGRASNHRVLRWLKTVVVSDTEKARLSASGGDREDVPEHPADCWSGVAVEASKCLQMASKPGVFTVTPGMSLAGVPLTGQVVPGMEAA